MTPVAALRSLVRPVRWPGLRRPAPRARARSAVVSGVLFAVAAHAGLAVAVETRRPEWRDPEFYHRLNRLVKLVRWEREQGHARPLVVVLGGSRPQMGLSPEHLGLGSGPADPLVFSLTQSGTLPVGERVNLARMFDAGVRPAFVLVEVLPPVLSEPGPMEDRIPAARLGHADLSRMRPYQTDPAKAARSWLRTRTNSWTALRVPLLANWGLADALPPGPNRSDFLWREMRYHGWSPYYPAAWAEADWGPKLAAARAGYAERLTDFAVRPVNDRAIRDTLAECRDRGVKAAVYTMPESAGFRAAYPPAARSAVTAYLAALGRDCGVPVFDTSAWDYPEAAYMDGHHLLGPAAEAFSRRFGRECVGPWVGALPRGGD